MTIDSELSEPAEDNAEIGPIVIFGAARSGTTYLTQILNRHPEVSISVEERLFLWVHQSLRVVPRNEHLFGGNRKLSERFTEYLNASYPQFVRQFYSDIAPEARYWGDKYPHYAASTNVRCLDTIAELFPRPKFLHIIRDGRDVAVSGLRGNWTNFDGVHRMWIDHVGAGVSFGATQPPERYFEVRYEELVRDDVAIAKRVFEFLEIDIHPAVVAFCEKQREERTPFRAPSRDLTSGAQQSDWATALDPEQRLASLDLIGDGLVTYGYETKESLASLRLALQEELSLATAERGVKAGERKR